MGRSRHQEIVRGRRGKDLQRLRRVGRPLAVGSRQFNEVDPRRREGVAEIGVGAGEYRLAVERHVPQPLCGRVGSAATTATAAATAAATTGAVLVDGVALVGHVDSALSRRTSIGANRVINRAGPGARGAGCNRYPGWLRGLGVPGATRIGLHVEAAVATRDREVHKGRTQGVDTSAAAPDVLYCEVERGSSDLCSVVRVVGRHRDGLRTCSREFERHFQTVNVVRHALFELDERRATVSSEVPVGLHSTGVAGDLKGHLLADVGCRVVDDEPDRQRRRRVPVSTIRPGGSFLLDTHHMAAHIDVAHPSTLAVCIDLVGHDGRASTLNGTGCDGDPRPIVAGEPRTFGQPGHGDRAAPPRFRNDLGRGLDGELTVGADRVFRVEKLNRQTRLHRIRIDCERSVRREIGRTDTFAVAHVSNPDLSHPGPGGGLKRDIVDACLDKGPGVAHAGAWIRAAVNRRRIPAAVRGSEVPVLWRQTRRDREHDLLADLGLTVRYGEVRGHTLSLGHREDLTRDGHGAGPGA